MQRFLSRRPAYWKTVFYNGSCVRRFLSLIRMRNEYIVPLKGGMSKKIRYFSRFGKKLVPPAKGSEKTPGRPAASRENRKNPFCCEYFPRFFANKATFFPKVLDMRPKYVYNNNMLRIVRQASTVLRRCLKNDPRQTAESTACQSSDLRRVFAQRKT